MSYGGKVYSKGRPRFSGKGHAYTPKNTRKFEKQLKENYLDARRNGVIMCPIYAKIVIYDKTPKSFTKVEKILADSVYIFSTTGDLSDNKVKSIIDAGNGILYADDSQIAKTNYQRMYHNFDGFTFELCRVGLSPAEAHNLGNLLK